jgi:hypothetical protein
MNEHSKPKASDDASESTGLPWPKTWKGTYVLVLCSSLLWVALLILLTELGA